MFTFKACLCYLKRSQLCPLKHPTFCTFFRCDHKQEKLVFIDFSYFISLFARLSVEQNTKCFEVLYSRTSASLVTKGKEAKRPLINHTQPLSH